MQRLNRAVLWVVMCGIAAVIAGCAGTDGGPSRILIPLTDTKSVAGNWSGNFLRDATSQLDFVKLTINDNGTYEISSTRQIGVFQGSGKASVQSGKLLIEGERGSAIFSLYDQGGNKYLKGQAKTKDGDTFSGELRPAR